MGGNGAEKRAYIPICAEYVLKVKPEDVPERLDVGREIKRRLR